MPKERITTVIREILDGSFGFELYIVMKNGEPLIKRLVLDEGAPSEQDSFKTRIKKGIEGTIRNKFLSDDCLYADGDDLANEQSYFYVIKQNEDYQPFSFVDTPEVQLKNFMLSDKDNADALMFKFIVQRNGEKKQLWAYQKIQPTSMPNRKSKFFQFVIKSPNQLDVFKEMKNQMFLISQNVDLLILGDEIITDNIGFMERHFGLENFLRASAARAVSLITTVNLVENEDKLQDYIQRSNKKYAKKMMQMHKFPVLSMEKDALIEKLQTVERWKNVFEIQDEQIHLRNYTDVERLIDFFIERYTKSEVTGQEYDTVVKEKVGQ